MSKKKVSVKKDNISSKKKANVCCLSWIWYALGFLLLLAALFFVYKGITGNAVYIGSFDLNSATRFVEPIGNFFLGTDGYSTQNLFERFLFFLLILSLVFVSLKKIEIFENQKKIVVLLAIIVSILSVRYINFEWLMTSLMTYSVLGIAIISFLPFVIYFFFLLGVAKSNPVLRKIGWIMFACIYLGLYLSADNSFYGQVYIWTFFAAVGFLFVEPYLVRYMARARVHYGREMDAVNKIATIDAQINAVNSSGLTADQKKRSIDELYKQRSFWEKYLA